MRITKLTNPRLVYLAVAALSIVIAPIAKAECGAAAHNSSGLSPALRSLPEPGPREEESDSNQAASPNADHDRNDDSRATIVGLWTVTFNSKGQVFDQGYDQWHSDGTEILNDIAPPEPANGSGAFCLGVYKKTGPRSFRLVHPAFAFDGAGNLAANVLLLENVTVDRNGKSYRGTFSFLEYDLSGNLIFQADGDLVAKRITAD
jgi:hypothetical protein